MELYTQRNGMRAPKETTYNISIDAYDLLLNCCEKYFGHLSEKYPDICPICQKCRGLNKELLDTALRYEIPNLFRKNGCIETPKVKLNFFSDVPEMEKYDQYSLLDLIELVAKNCKDYELFYDDDCGHSYLYFLDSNTSFTKFQKEINNIFDMVGLSYILNNSMQIERIVQNSPLTEEIVKNISEIREDGTRKLLQEAIDLHKRPHLNARRDSVEKIWDAFERIKSYYTNLNKHQSADKIINDISNKQSAFVDLFNTEFKSLTDIGNKFRIRHHEINRIDINDVRYYDYFFNRCLALIALVIQYLK